jgi:malate dehydrogenase (oxaloacetate-decarboxylating)(NADP+)
MDTGVARRPIADMEAYRESLERILGRSREVMHLIVHKARQRPSHTLVFPEGEHETTLRAARAIIDQRIARPILVGRAAAIEERSAQVGLARGDFEVVDPQTSPKSAPYAEALYALRSRKGVTPRAAAARVQDPVVFSLMMLREGDAEGFVGGLDRPYPELIRPAIQLVGLRQGVSRVSALQLLVLKERLFFFADTMVNIEPTAEELAEIACLTADTARVFDIEPRIAMLSFSSFGSVTHPLAQRVAEATARVKQRRPGLVVDGEMHLDTAVVEEIVRENYPHSRIRGDANVLVFPNLAAGNIGYKLVQRLGRAESIGPILMGTNKPVAVLQHGTTVADIVNLAAITAVMSDLSEPGGEGHRVQATPAG